MSFADEIKVISDKNNLLDPRECWGRKLIPNILQYFGLEAVLSEHIAYVRELIIFLKKYGIGDVPIDETDLVKREKFIKDIVEKIENCPDKIQIEGKRLIWKTEGIGDEYQTIFETYEENDLVHNKTKNEFFCVLDPEKKTLYELTDEVYGKNSFVVIRYTMKRYEKSTKKIIYFVRTERDNENPLIIEREWPYEKEKCWSILLGNCMNEQLMQLDYNLGNGGMSTNKEEAEMHLNNNYQIIEKDIKQNLQSREARLNKKTGGVLELSYETLDFEVERQIAEQLGIKLEKQNEVS